MYKFVRFSATSTKITALPVLRGEMENVTGATWRVHRNFYPRTFVEHSKFVQTCALTAVVVGMHFHLLKKLIASPEICSHLPP